MSERTTCQVKNGMLEPCVGLERACESHRGRGKGLHIILLMNVKTGKFSRGFAQLNSGRYARDGVVINYCPLCGKNIVRHMLPNEEAPHDAAE